MANGMMTTGAMTVSDVIEGEFTAHQDSGFSCRRCEARLPVGACACPHCRRSFGLPTPDIRNVPPGPSPARAKVMAAIYRDRVSDSEIEANYAKRGLTRPADD